MSSTTTRQCDALREDTPRYDRQADTFDPDPSIWAPDCGHPACVADDHDGLHGWDCPVAVCRWDTLKATCELDEGHEGDHDFEPLLPEERP